MLTFPWIRRLRLDQLTKLPSPARHDLDMLKISWEITAWFQILTPVISPTKLWRASNPPPTESWSCPKSKRPPGAMTWPKIKHKVSCKKWMFYKCELTIFPDLSHLEQLGGFFEIGTIIFLMGNNTFLTITFMFLAHFRLRLLGLITFRHFRWFSEVLEKPRNQSQDGGFKMSAVWKLWRNSHVIRCNSFSVASLKGNISERTICPPSIVVIALVLPLPSHSRWKNKQTNNKTKLCLDRDLRRYVREGIQVAPKEISEGSDQFGSL